MRQRLQLLSLRIRTAIALAEFGVLALALGFVVLPCVRLLDRRSESPELRVQRILHRCARFHLRFMQSVCGTRFRVHNAEALRRDGPHVVVANHPSQLDIVCLCALMPQADCIVSSARTESILLRGLIRAAGHVPDDDPSSIVSECASRLRAGRSLIVFPEGTRSPANGLGPFRRGAARIAFEAGCDLVPVILHYDPPVMYKGWRLRDLPDRPIHATVRVLEPIPSKAGGERGKSPAGVARKLTAELREFFLEGLDIGDVGRAGGADQGADHRRPGPRGCDAGRDRARGGAVRRGPRSGFD